jgi:hypothetical protein
VLADYFDEVIILDRDDLPDDAHAPAFLKVNTRTFS